jgi:hypothetical protein
MKLRPSDRSAPDRPAPDRPAHGTDGWAKRNWKRVALGAVVVFIVISVARALLPALGLHMPSIGTPAGQTSTGPGGKTTKAKNTPPPAADLNGVQILGGGAPLVMLDPGLARLGAPVTVNGSGFDAGSRVDVLLSTKGSKAQQVAMATAAKDGSFSASFTFPSALEGGETTREVTAQQRGGNKVAKAEVGVEQGAAQAKLSATTGKPGDTVTLTAQGFSPGEDLAVYWGRINGTPVMNLKADSGGSVGKVPVRVGAVSTGITSLVIVGKSGAAATASFQVLRMYPTITLKPYAVKAEQKISFAGKGFVPGERVLVRVNSAGGQPVMAVPTDESGAFSSAGFIVPYQLTGKQSLVFVGEQSRASVAAAFSVLPYMPQARASTYGGLPGTAVRFYATNFAPNEAVHVFVGGGKGGGGELVSAFRVDASGKASAAGSYIIPGDAQNSVTFSLVGARSKATATVVFKVDSSGEPVDVPPQPKYQLPKDLEN